MDGGSRRRLHTIDGLRGVAALLVAVYHLAPAALEGATGTMPALIREVARYGYLGVPIFFVLSGFVIASTIDRTAASLGYIGRFALKRSIRLDPPYWVSIALDCALIFVAGNLLGASDTPLPTPEAIAAHLLYAQDLAGMKPIAAIYWTLCLEIQFYLCICLVVVASNRAAKWLDRPTAPIAGALLLLITGASIAIGAGLISNPLRGLFLSHWYLFALGACCSWATAANQGRTFIAYTVAVGALFLWQATDSPLLSLNTLAALVTSITLFVATRLNKMSNWLASRPLLFLGSISYSLYLFHAAIGERFIEGMKQIALPRLGIEATATPAAISLLVVALLVSAIAATIAYRVIEAPAMRLSKLIGSGAKPDSSSTPVTAAGTHQPGHSTA